MHFEISIVTHPLHITRLTEVPALVNGVVGLQQFPNLHGCLVLVPVAYFSSGYPCSSAPDADLVDLVYIQTGMTLVVSLLISHEVS